MWCLGTRVCVLVCVLVTHIRLCARPALLTAEGGLVLVLLTAPAHGIVKMQAVHGYMPTNHVSISSPFIINTFRALRRP